MGRVPQHIIDRVLSSTDIVDVVGAFVRLTPRGANHVGLCPFHREKTPSFSVHRERQIFKCFGCGKGGTALTFLQETENLTFREALQVLADRANIEVPADTPERHQAEPDIDRHEVMRKTAEKFVSWLGESPAALKYLEGRGLSKEDMRRFGLGYAPDSWEALTTFLRKTVPLKVAEELGLVVPGRADRAQREGPNYYDRFRNRVMFPIINTLSKVIAFGGRTLGDDRAKYLNSPETSLFAKSRTLYLLDQAREASKAEGYLIVVEGYLDAISLHLAGFRQTVATLGTAITEEHVRVVQRYCERAVLMYDGDTAGVEAARKGVGAFLATGRPVDVVLLPTGEDPDSYVRTNGPEGLGKLVEEASDGFEILIRQALERHGRTGAAAKRSVCAELLPVLTRVPSKVLQREYLEMLAGHLGTSMDALEQDMKSVYGKRQQPPPPARPEEEPVETPLRIADLTQHQKAVTDMVCLVLQDGGVIPGEDLEYTEDPDEPKAGFLPLERRNRWKDLAKRLLEPEDGILTVLEWALDCRAGKPLSSHLQRLEEEHPRLSAFCCEILERWVPNRYGSRRMAARQIEANVTQLLQKKELADVRSSKLDRKSGDIESNRDYLSAVDQLTAERKRT